MSIEPTSILIRPARKEDAAVIAHLVALLATNLQESSPVDESYVRNYLDTTGGGVLVAEVKGEVAGVLSYTLRPNLYHAAPTCLIEELVVKEGFRDGGIGSRLLEAAVEMAKEYGCAEVSISALTTNRKALDLYRRLGFVDEAVLLEQHF